MSTTAASNPAVRPGPGRYIPGLILVALVGLCAAFLSELPFAPFTLAGGRRPLEPVMLAILLGMVVANGLVLPQACAPGVKFAAKRLLPLGIVLLGARLDFMAIVRVGALGIVLSVLTILLALLIFAAFVKMRLVEGKLGVLLGVGTAICGGTAIVATAPVIDAEDSDVSFAVATVTVLGLVAMFLLPLIGHALHLSDHAFGVWAGLSIHQTPQVVAAGFAYSGPAGESATIVKLARVSLLAPVVAMIGIAYASRRARSTDAGGPISASRLFSLFPPFVAGFLVMALLRTLGWLPSFSVDGLHIDTIKLSDQVSRYLIIAAMAAVGLETRFSALRRTGPRPFVLGAITSLIICGLVILALETIT
jgi:uncharacterized integral membrane protein (TIGR00698 family)